MLCSSRILHTSDWHLGASIGPASKGKDHKLFLNWLADALVWQRVDVLLVAGDVPHQQSSRWSRCERKAGTGTSAQTPDGPWAR